jgi:hypothetical protein
MSSNLRPAFISQPFLLRVFPHIMYIHTKCWASGGASVGRTTVAAGYSFSIVCWPAGWRARERTMYTCTQSTYIKWRTDTALARNICVCRGISEPWCFLCDYSSLLSHHSLSNGARARFILLDNKYCEMRRAALAAFAACKSLSLDTQLCSMPLLISNCQWLFLRQLILLSDFFFLKIDILLWKL